jgi:hypothetical protein
VAAEAAEPQQLLLPPASQLQQQCDFFEDIPAPLICTKISK